MSRKLASTAPSDADKTSEQLLAEIGELRSRNAVLKESSAKSTKIQNRPRSRVEEEFRRANRALKALSECKEAMIRAGDEAVLLNDICRIIVDVGGYRMAWIGYIENDEVKTVRPVARAGYDEGYVDNLKIALEDPVRGNGPTGICLKTGKPYGSMKVLSDEEMLPWRADALKRGYHSTLNLPIVYEKQVIGALVIYSGKADAFDEEERGLLFELAKTLAYGITAMRDRARRIRAENELKLANEELEARVEERTIKLSESEASLARSQAIAHLGNWEVDVRTNKVRGSDELYRMFNLEPDVTLDAYIEKMHPEDREKTVESINAAIYEGNPYNIDYRIVPHPDDVRYVHAEGKVTHDKNGLPLKFFGTVQDITERKRAEEALRNSEEKYRSLVENINYMVWEMDENYTCTYASPKTIDVLGYAPDEVVGKKPFDFILLKDSELLLEVFNSIIAEPKPFKFITYTATKKDGTPIIIETNGTPKYDADGKFIGFMGINRDVTELERAKEELKEAKTQADLYLDLMGHDINNMNQVGMGYLEVALETLKEEGRIEEKDTELLEKPLRALQDSSRLIDNVRKLRSAKSREYQLQPIDLREVLKGVKEQYSKVNGRHIMINYTPTDGYVLATGLVKDVFVNIVGNAVKHSDANKSLEISISHIHVYGTDESYHKVIIDDNGPGIPDELKTRIFNRFERGNTKAKGKGLGLYLVKTLVQDFDGKIWVEDRVQGDYTKGARFVVILPAAEK